MSSRGAEIREDALDRRGKSQISGSQKEHWVAANAGVA